MTESTEDAVGDLGDEAQPEQSVEEAEADVAADLDALSRERDELRVTAQRVQADFENYKKRMLRAQTDAVERANEQLIERLLPVLDSFEAALAQLPEASSSPEAEKVRKGVELVFTELLGVLENAGLERIETTGAPFDPNVHEAVMHEEGDGDPIVTDTMRTGYRFKQKVLRPAMVKVGR
jgi:molecular chaperone GrpE